MRAWRHDETADTAHVDACRQVAASVGESPGVAKQQMSPARRSDGDGHDRDGVVGAQGTEGGNAIGCAGMLVQIDDKQARAVQIDAGDAIRVRLPPGADLRAQCGCLIAPPDDGFFLKRAVLQFPDSDRKHGDAAGGVFQRSGEIVAHHTPPRITMGDEGAPNF
jgi:hypothetical protein